MGRIAAELQDVPLGDAQVFQEPPGAVGHGRDRAAAEGGWHIGHRLVEGEVGAAAPEQVEEVFAEGLVRIGSHRGVSGWSGSVVSHPVPFWLRRDFFVRFCQKRQSYW